MAKKRKQRTVKHRSTARKSKKNVHSKNVTQKQRVNVNVSSGGGGGSTPFPIFPQLYQQPQPQYIPQPFQDTRGEDVKLLNLLNTLDQRYNRSVNDNNFQFSYLPPVTPPNFDAPITTPSNPVANPPVTTPSIFDAPITPSNPVVNPPPDTSNESLKKSVSRLVLNNDILKNSLGSLRKVVKEEKKELNTDSELKKELIAHVAPKMEKVETEEKPNNDLKELLNIPDEILEGEQLYAVAAPVSEQKSEERKEADDKKYNAMTVNELSDILTKKAAVYKEGVLNAYIRDLTNKGLIAGTYDRKYKTASRLTSSELIELLKKIDNGELTEFAKRPENFVEIKKVPRKKG